MSEPISAFAVYQTTNSKKANIPKKSQNKKVGNRNVKNNKKNTSKNKSFEEHEKRKPVSKSQTNVKKSSVPKENITSNQPKNVAGSKSATKGAQAKNKNTASKATNKPDIIKEQKPSKNAVTNGKHVPKKNHNIKESQIDALVEQLLGDSPSNPKQLTKVQQKKKQELEEYLVQELENDEAKTDEDESESEKDEEEESGSEEYSTDSDEFSDEYTINSYSDEDESSKESSIESPVQIKPVATSTTNSHAQKRSNNEKTDKLANGAPQKKKARESENAVNKRKSMPAAAASTTETIEKLADKQRHSLAESTDVSNTKVSIKTVDANVVKMEPLSPPNNIIQMNSIKEGEKVFSWLLSPLSIKDFFTKYWETAACLVKRKGSNYYSHLISFDAIDQMLIKNHVEFTKNIDVTSYENGERQTLNPEGRAMPPVVWDHYGQGCSIRLLNPQTFLPDLHTFNATLQEYFHCLVGANAYLTPPNSQGFAPHYDDIEAFVLQIEGRKRWRLYKPRTEAEQLPRVSSKNFAQNEIGKPIFDEVLEPGDMLYFPRGTIHQACTEPGYHSLHITLSVYQKQSYADLFERMMPLILQRAIENNIDMRRGLPLHTFQHAGIAYSDNDTKERADLLRRVTRLMGQCLHSASLNDVMDAAVDQLAKKYQTEALPPHVLPTERARTIFGSRSTTNERGECLCDYEITERTNVRPLRANIMRLVQEEDKVRIYYYLDNSKEYCQYEPNFIEIEPEEAASVEVLIRSYPEYVGVSQLPLPDDERKVQMATALWERGLLMTEKPFK